MALRRAWPPGAVEPRSAPSAAAAWPGEVAEAGLHPRPPNVCTGLRRRRRVVETPADAPCPHRPSDAAVGVQRREWATAGPPCVQDALGSGPVTPRQLWEVAVQGGVYPAPTRPPSLPTSGKPGVPDVTLSSVTCGETRLTAAVTHGGPVSPRGRRGQTQASAQAPERPRLEASAVPSVW